MYQTLAKRLSETLSTHIRGKYGVEVEIVLNRPPKLDMGEAASPVCFELAKRLKKAPRQIAQEIATNLGEVEGIARVEVAGGGYLNAYFDRGAFWESAQKEASEPHPTANAEQPKIIVEHTSINPNKAAHIGHVRNAVLGDTMVRILRHAGKRVQIQNYIDNTGVQVADVVIGLLRMEERTVTNVMALAREPKFDYYCWDLYAKATSFFAEDSARAAKLRGETLKSIEENRGEDAEVGQVVSDAIVKCHLNTMARLDIHYDLLARESEILHLKFWDTAFEMLRKSGAIHFAETGKMKGCWVLPWEEKARINTENAEAESTEDTEKKKDEEREDENEQDKIIVRSNGTVTYVGKDIAYQLWKFGLLGKDFCYRKWPGAPAGQTVWATTGRKSEPEAPHFGEPAVTVYNVIDARQAYPQDVVAEGLRRLGHTEAAKNSIHLSYSFVVLTPRCATEMGYELSPEDAKRPFVDMSGRKGFGVKADDLMDKMEEATLNEVRQRHPEMSERDQKRTAHAIAVGALRFFLLKVTRNSIIAFDFKDALSFEGETGPYCQNAVVRIRGIRRKDPKTATPSPKLKADSAKRFLSEADAANLWELLLGAGSLDYAVDASIATQEPAFVAKYAFQLAGAFHTFYHKHHVLSEADEEKRAFLLQLTELVEAQLVRALSLLGIEAPEKM